jgi:D-alanyl-D-alanine carboxypeptidase
VPDTAALFLEHTRLALQAAGVTVETPSVRACGPQSLLQADLSIASAPIGQVLNSTLQNSDNLYAEVCFFLRYQPACVAVALN